MYRLLEKIATPFERLTPIFGVLVFNDAISNTVRFNRKSDFQDGGRQTGSTYISASTQYSKTVRTANPSILWVKQLDGDIANTVRCNGKSAFEDGGC